MSVKGMMGGSSSSVLKLSRVKADLRVLLLGTGIKSSMFSTREEGKMLRATALREVEVAAAFLGVLAGVGNPAMVVCGAGGKPSA